MRIYLTNLGKYNEGELVGLWLKLPCTDEEIQTALKQIGIGEQYEETFITDCENDLGLTVDEHTSLRALNEVAKCVDGLSVNDLHLLQAVIELESVKVSDVVEVIGRLNEYILHPHITNEEELGRFLIHNTGEYDIEAIGKLAEYMDYEAYGRDENINSDGGFTSKGWVSH